MIFMHIVCVAYDQVVVAFINYVTTNEQLQIDCDMQALNHVSCTKFCPKVEGLGRTPPPPAPTGFIWVDTDLRLIVKTTAQSVRMLVCRVVTL